MKRVIIVLYFCSYFIKATAGGENPQKPLPDKPPRENNNNNLIPVYVAVGSALFISLLVANKRRKGKKDSQY
jgi:hypothetical protein